MFRSDDNSYDMETILVKVMKRATVLSSLRDTRAVLKALVTNAVPAKQSSKSKSARFVRRKVISSLDVHAAGTVRKVTTKVSTTLTRKN
eukprot:snap_masked-scaffold_65-processed-gene-0.17-mRNA-1 protein AED:1.00 eAED:1.00 QI:0/-1/0/0/-1/1/1/0/88